MAISKNVCTQKHTINIEYFQSKRQSLIVSSNSEWTQILSLRNLVRYEFEARGFLTATTFDAVTNWKLRKQRNRTEKHRVGNSAELIQELTGAFWRVKHEDKDKLLAIQLAILLAIPGVGIGVASAIFTLCYPREYAIIDFRNWKVLYGENKRQFSQADYKKYITDMRELAEKVDCEVQELDYLLWKEYE
jgi:thermostable 8-oxoguanine DNA glycosylase